VEIGGNEERLGDWEIGGDSLGRLIEIDRD
jgi:hypothetical protein